MDVHAPLAAKAILKLATRLRGELIAPGTEGYEDARQVWNGVIDQRPALIARPADVGDVVAAVNFAREHGLALAVRSGGHGFAGHGTNDGGLVIDLSCMKELRIDPERRIARAQPGLTWGEYAARAQEYGLATSSGDVATVGVGGLTVGGGIGWMVRKHGLTIDHLLSAEIVTADGQVRWVSADEHPDLFWALRGGGSNFGIATSLEFRLHPAGMVIGGAVFYPIAQAREVLREYVRYAPTAPDELTTMAMIMQAPPAPFIPAEAQGSLGVALLVCYTGDLDEGRRVVAPLRSLGTPIADIVDAMPYPAMYAITEEASVKGRRHDVRSMFLDAVDDNLIETLIAHADRMVSPLAMFQLRVLGGAMARVPEGATAFAHRAKPFMLTSATDWEDDRDAERQRAWTRAAWESLHPYASGVYVNFLSDDGPARIREAYPPATYERLAAIKSQYDPTNLFHVNQNIQPARRLGEQAA